MNGIFGGIQELQQGALSGRQMLDPRTAGMLSAAFQGLQASQPQARPVGLAGVLGQAGMAGMQGYQQAAQQQQQMRNQVMQRLIQERQLQSLEETRRMQVLERQEKLKKAEDDQRALEEWVVTLPEHERPLARRFPEMFGRMKQSEADIKARAEESRRTREEADARNANLRGILASQAQQAASEREQDRREAREREIRLIASLRPAPAPQPVTPTKIMQDGREVVVDARTGRVIGEAPLDASSRRKSPAGMQYDENGNLVPIPGTAAHQRMSDRYNKAVSGMSSLTQAMETIDRLKTHNGRTAATGGSSVFNIIPGKQVWSPKRQDFLNELNTFKSQAFLTNIDKLRGTGPLSNMEGEKLERAMGNIDPTTSDDEFLKSLDRVREQIQTLQSVARQELDELGESIGRSRTPSAPTNTGAPPPGAVRPRGR